MPMYEYFCLDCRKITNALRPIRQADTPIRCHSCESERTRRKLSLVAATVSSANDSLTLGGGCGCGGACACGNH